METNSNPTKKEDIMEVLKRIAMEATKRRKGKKLIYDKKEFYEQYEKRLKRAGL